MSKEIPVIVSMVETVESNIIGEFFENDLKECFKCSVIILIFESLLHTLINFKFQNPSQIIK